MRASTTYDSDSDTGVDTGISDSEILDEDMLLRHLKHTPDNFFGGQTQHVWTHGLILYLNHGC